jgi:hypothetical protein
MAAQVSNSLPEVLIVELFISQPPSPVPVIVMFPEVDETVLAVDWV